MAADVGELLQQAEKWEALVNRMLAAVPEATLHGKLNAVVLDLCDKVARCRLPSDLSDDGPPLAPLALQFASGGSPALTAALSSEAAAAGGRAC